MKKYFAALRMALVGFLTLVFWVSCTSTGESGEGYQPPLDPAVHQGTLKNGFQYYLLPNKTPANRAVFWLVVKAGSLQEKEDQRGLAHLLEHMAFNGTKNFKRNDLVKYFESIGMAFGDKLNAFTSFGETVYQLEIPMDQPEILQSAFQILEDWARYITLDAHELEKEKGVVQEEWRLSQGVRTREQEFLLPLMFNGSLHSDRLPIGSMPVVMGSQVADLQEFYKEWYRPDLMALLAVGDFDPQVLEEFVDKHFSFPSPSGPPHKVEKVEKYAGRSVYQFSDPELTMDLVRVVTVMDPYKGNYETRLRRAVISALAEGTVNFRLDQASKASEPPFLGAYLSYNNLSRHVPSRFEVVAPIGQNFDTALESYLKIVGEIRQNGVSLGEFQREKETQLNAVEEYFSQSRSRESKSLIDGLLDFYMEGEAFASPEESYETARKVLKSVTLEDLNRFLASQFTHTQSRVLVSVAEGDGPGKDWERDLEAVFQRVKGMKFQASVQGTGPQELMSAPPQGGRIVSEVKNEALGLVVWTLDNGATVTVKPTAFKSQEIVVMGVSPGGLSTVADADVLALEYAPDLLLDGGAGELSGEDLRRILASKLTRFEVSLLNSREEIRASTNPKELEHFFQLLHLTSKIRKDTPSFSSALTRLKASYTNKAKDPFQNLRDELRRVTYGNHPRGVPVTSQLLSGISEDRSYTLFMDKLTNASDWSYVVVGDVDLEALRPLVETYVGSLPTRKVKEKVVDRNIRPLKGPLVLDVKKGLEPKTFVVLYDSIVRPFSLDLSVRSEALENILSQRVREKIRESLGGTYDISFSLYPDKHPFEHIQMIISFGCEPQREKELVAAVKAEVSLLLTQGITPEDLQKYKTLKTRNLEVDRKTNDWWAQRISNYPLLGYTLEDLGLLDKRIEALTQAEVDALARGILNPAQWIQINLKQQ